MASCLTPFLKGNEKTGESMQLPCGRCANCLKRRTSSWSFRLRKEVQRAKNAHFVTLTYDPDNVPLSKNGFMTLNKEHVQLFIKSIRNYEKRNAKQISSLSGRTITTDKLTYYACGEYGSIGERPHYHILIFNCDVQGIEEAWSHTKRGFRVASRIKRGTVYHGHDVSEAAIGYTLKYISKSGRVPKFQRDDRVPEFSLMSKGIGSNYLTERMIDWHKNDLFGRYYVPIEDGKRIAMPEYYKRKIYTPAERTFAARQAALKHPQIEVEETTRVETIKSTNRAYFKKQEQKPSKL